MPNPTPVTLGSSSGFARRIAFLIAVVMMTAGAPAVGWGQTPAPLTAPVAATTATATATPDGMVMQMLSGSRDRMADFRGNLAQRLRAAPDIPEALVDTLTEKSPTGQPVYFLRIVGLTILLLAIGHGIQHLLYERPIARRLLPHAPEVPRPGGSAPVSRFPVLVLRALLSAVGMILAGLIGFGFAVAVIENPPPTTEETVILVGVGYFLTWAITLFWRLVLLPDSVLPGAPAVPSPPARRLWRDLSLSGAFGVVAMTGSVWLEALEMERDPHAVLVALLGLLTALAMLAALHANRRTVDRIILGERSHRIASPLERLSLRLWFPLVAAYFAFAWGALANRLILGWPVELPLLIGAYAVAVSVLTVYAGVDYAIERLFQRRKANWRLADPADDEGGEDMPPAVAEPFARPIDSYEALARRVATILAAVAGVSVALSVWRIPMMHGDWANRLIGVMSVCLIGYVAYHTVRIWIDRKIADEGPAPSTIPGDEGGGHGSVSRLATLLPLIRNFILVSIVGAVLLSVLMDLGVNIAPLFAGAGVAGIAIGFGAQTLIRDIFSGAFFLIDDAFRKGEYIEIGAIRGTVEKISVRSMQLRHHRGPLHTVPFGEIHQLTNYSRDWVIMKLPLRITYDTDVEKVRKHIKILGQSLLDDPDIGPKFLQPLKSQGVIQMEDSAMILRVKFMTRPGDQWEIRKRVFQELHTLFRREGIRFAHREVTVRFADGTAPAGPNPGTDEATRTLAAGAALHALAEETRGREAKAGKSN